MRVREGIVRNAEKIPVCEKSMHILIGTLIISLDIRKFWLNFFVESHSPRTSSCTDRKHPINRVTALQVAGVSDPYQVMPP